MFLVIAKQLIAKATTEYVLIKLSCGQSVILSTKFFREKKTEENVFASVPEDYKIKLRRTKYNPSAKKYELVSEETINAWGLREELKLIDEYWESCDLEDILDFDFNPLPF